MLKRRVHLLVIAFIFLITFSMTGLSIAQTDDAEPVPPTEPPPFDWANVELPPHDFDDADFAQAQQFLDQGEETAVSSPIHSAISGYVKQYHLHRPSRRYPVSHWPQI